METTTRRLVKNSSYSYSVNIPKSIVDKYGWRAKQKLSIKDKGRGLLEIRDWKKR